MIFDGFVHQLPDIDPGETKEWLDSLEAVVDVEGKTRARYLISKLLERCRELQVGFPATVSTPYINTIPSEQEPWFPGDDYIELVLDTSETHPQVIGRASRGRGRRVLESETPLGHGAVRDLTEEDVLAFVMKELEPLVER